MIYRMVYKAVYKNKDAFLSEIKMVEQNDEVYTLTAFEFAGNAYVYYECINREIEPNELFANASEYLIANADGSLWTRLYDIFHYDKPIDMGNWKRKIAPTPHATVNRLKPEKLCSYIFYHFQYQEEKPCDGPKYSAIYLDGNFMFFYHESPEVKEPAGYKGLLNTNNTPDGWGELMGEHFLPWDDYDGPWRNDVKVLYTTIKM